MNTMIRWAAVQLMVLLVGATFVSALESGETPTVSSTKEKRFIAAIDADGVQRVEVTGDEYYFEPNDIMVKVNVPVEIKARKASGLTPHDIVVNAPEAGIDFKAKLGTEWTTIRFTPTKAGKYEMFCDERFLWFKSHKDRGMDGWIEVVP